MRGATRAAVGGASITALGCGCVGIGGLYEPVSDADAEGALASALGHGVTYFDAAPVYGLGRAEQRLGHFLSSRSASHSITVSTKVGRLLRPLGAEGEVDRVASTYFAGADKLQPIFDYSYDGTLQSLEESLVRLSRDRIDLVFVHDPDAHVDEAVAGACRALQRLRDEGTIKAFGVGASSAATLAAFARRVDVDCLLVAGRYTLLDQSALVEVLPLCWEEQVAVIVGGAFNSGVLANPRSDATFDYVQAPPQTVELARKIERLTIGHGVPLAAAALQFAFGHPSVRGVLMGPRSEREVDQDVEWFEHPIPADLWSELKHAGLLPDGVPTPETG